VKPTLDEDSKLLIKLNPDMDRSLHPVILEANALALAHGVGKIGRSVLPFLKRID
jgi:hypothetical protein